MTFSDAPEVLKIEQAAELLQISKPQMYELVHANGFPAFRIGRCIRISREVLREWVERQAKISSI